MGDKVRSPPAAAIGTRGTPMIFSNHGAIPSPGFGGFYFIVGILKSGFSRTPPFGQRAVTVLILV